MVQTIIARAKQGAKTIFKIGRLSGMPITVACLLTLLIGGCNNTGALIGSTVKGTRIAVMEKKDGPKADPDLKDTKPQLPAMTNNAAWPQAGYDTAHLMPNAALGDKPKKIWSASIGEGASREFKLLARPVVSQGRIYTMDSQGKVSCFDTKDGDQKWSTDTAPENHEDEAIGGGIGVDGGTLFATTGFGEVLSIDTKDGKIKWRKSMMKPVRAAPTIADGRVYVVSIDNELFALDETTGEQDWKHSGIAESATLMGASNPAVVGDSVVIAYSSGEIYDLRAENGRVSWNYSLATASTEGMPAIADIRGLPVIEKDRVLAVSHSGRTAAIDHRSGDRDWETDVGGVNTPIIGGDTVFILTNETTLVALQRESGRIMWIQQLQTLTDPEDKTSDRLAWAGPVLAGNRLWLTNSLGELIAFAPDKGTQTLSIDLDDPIYMPPIVADKTIYVVTNSGELIALR